MWMWDRKKNILETNKHLSIYLLFDDADDKLVKNITESLKAFNITVHKFTDVVKETWMINQIIMLNFSVEYNYVARSLQEIDEEELIQIIEILYEKNVKYIPLAIFYRKKIIRLRLSSPDKKEIYSLVCDPILDD